MPRGGWRPGAGAPKGNINGLKSGLYSRQLKALNLAMEQMPGHGDLIRRLTAGNVRNVELLAYVMRWYSDILLMKAHGGSIDDLHDVRSHAALAYILGKWDHQSGKRRREEQQEGRSDRETRIPRRLEIESNAIKQRPIQSKRGELITTARVRCQTRGRRKKRHRNHPIKVRPLSCTTCRTRL